MTSPRTIEHVVCLGCGCACDDIAVVVSAERIVEVRNACPAGRAWFGDGQVPGRVQVGGAAAPLEAAVARIAELLHANAPALVYLAPDVATEAQREAIALADALQARLDSVSSDTIAASVLAGQRRGRATATLGEIRNRADLLVFWAVDPAQRYSRFLERYALDPVGLQVPDGRAGRTVIAVDVGGVRAVADATQRLSLAADEEIAALAVMRAVVLGRELPGLGKGLAAAAELAQRMMQARYVVIVHDAEPPAEARGSDVQRAEGLIALAQALNGPTRCALSSLRAGGNRSGADAAMTWQTGFPFAVDFTTGVPRYRADEPASVLAAEVRSALIVGSADAVPAAVARALGRVPLAIVGPRASEAALRAEAVIDTGVAGIHEDGVGYRMDDVPLPLRTLVPGPARAATVPHAITTAVHAARATAAAAGGAAGAAAEKAR